MLSPPLSHLHQSRLHSFACSCCACATVDPARDSYGRVRRVRQLRAKERTAHAVGCARARNNRQVALYWPYCQKTRSRAIWGCSRPPSSSWSPTSRPPKRRPHRAKQVFCERRLDDRVTLLFAALHESGSGPTRKCGSTPREPAYGARAENFCSV